MTSWIKSLNGSLKSTSVPAATITAGTYTNSTANLIDLASTSGSNYVLDVITVQTHQVLMLHIQEQQTI